MKLHTRATGERPTEPQELLASSTIGCRHEDQRTTCPTRGNVGVLALTVAKLEALDLVRMLDRSLGAEEKQAAEKLPVSVR